MGNLDCLVAMAAMNRSSLLRKPLYAAFEAIDNYLGSADFNDAAVVSRIRLALAAIKATPSNLKATDVAEYLGLRTTSASLSSTPRVIQYPSVLGSPQGTSSVTMKAWSHFLLKFEGTIVATRTSQNFVHLQVGSARISRNPAAPPAAPKDVPLTYVSIGFCRVNGAVFEARFTDGNFTGLTPELVETVTDTQPLTMNHATAIVRVPDDDPSLSKHWLCAQAHTVINSIHGTHWSHSTEATTKGCNNCF
jgi:hypothetical protein